MKHLCIMHDLEFPNDKSFEEHKKLDHTKKPILPPGITEDMLPDAEFVKKIEALEKPQPINNNPIITPDALLTNDNTPRTKDLSKDDELPLSEKLPPKKALKLVYQFEGNCPDCDTKIDTLFFKIGRASIVTAYCSYCKTNKAERTVKPL